MSRLYSPLSFDAYEVRMLTLSRNAASHAVECTMHTVSLVYNPPKYVALSYCWGDESIKKDIVMDGTIKAVTINLEEALQQLRWRLSEGTMLWVDALCINQDDLQERSQQVRFMKLIYEKAETVYAWLGGEGFEDALRGLQAAQNLRNSSPEQNNASGRDLVSTACTGLLSVCRCQYWQRRWIIQELTAASNVEVICRTESMTLQDLRSAYLQCKKSEFWLSEHKLVSNSFAQTLKFRRRFHEGRQLSLPEAILDTKQYLSKDARDKVYALIGICSDGPSLVPTPNYLQSIEEICIDLTRAILQRNANFELILSHSRAKDMDSAFSLPTWSPNWSSPDLERIVISIADEAPSWPRSFATAALRAKRDVIKMQGVTLGTVVALTSPLGWENPMGTGFESFSSEPYSDKTMLNYGSKRRVAMAVVCCLLSPVDFGDNKAIPANIVKRISMWSLRFKVFSGGKSDSPNPRSTFLAWQKTNERFKIDNLSIPDCFRLRYQPTRLYVFTVLLILSLSLIPLAGVVWTLVPNRTTLAMIILTALFLIFWVSFATIYLAVGTRSPAPFGLREPARHLSRKIDQAQRLFVLDRGTIGMAHADTKIGDKVCLLAGCTRLAVLEERSSHGSIQYSVVGGASAELSRSDRKRYDALYRYDYPLPREQKADVNKLEKYKKETWWETFEVI